VSDYDDDDDDDDDDKKVLFVNLMMNLYVDNNEMMKIMMVRTGVGVVIIL